jgi:drug/metabolite transporter (DMT)-like permease
VVTTASGVLVYGERLTLLQIAGAASVLAAVVVLRRR